MKKKLLLFLSVLIFAAALTVMFAVQTSAATSGYYTYTVSGGSATITDVGESISGDITIPSTLRGYPVKAIESGAFYNCTKLTGVEFPSTVTSIGNDLFRGCVALTSITVADGNSSYHATNNCLISTMTKTLVAGCKTSVIPSDGSVTSIGSYAFGGCNITHIEIPYGVVSINEGAFQCCDLKTLIIPNTVSYVAHEVIDSCFDVIVLVNKRSSSGWSSSWNEGGRPVIWNFKELYTDSQGVTYALTNDNTASVLGFDNSVADVVLSVEGYTVNQICENAFLDCEDFNSIIIPDSVTKVGAYAFYRTPDIICAEATECPATWNTSWNYFDGCPVIWNFKELYTDSQGVTYALTNDNTASVLEFDNSVADVVLSVEGYTVNQICAKAFWDCEDFNSIIIPDSVTKVGAYAFYTTTGIIYAEATECPASWNTSWNRYGRPVIWNFKELYTDSQGVTYVLKNNNTASVLEFDNSVANVVLGVNGYTINQIANSAFYNCDILTSITIPNGVTEIGYSAFYSCSNLTSVVIPDSVTSIGNWAFSSCYKLSNVEIQGSPSIGDSAFAWISSYNDGMITFLQTPSSLADSEYTIDDGVTIYCYADNTTVKNYAQKYGRNIMLMPCKNGCIYEDIIDDVYMISGSCSQRAVYYKSCSVCQNASGTLTFEGDYIHYYTQQTVSDSYLKKAATCTDKAVYYQSCICGKMSEDLTFAYGNALGHTYNDVCDAVCNVCRYERKAPHNCETDWMKDNQEHWHDCLDCGAKIMLAAHTYSGSSDTSCNTCGYKRSFVTVSYNANGGSSAPSSQTVEKGKSVTVSNSTPTRSGYKFQGWATNVVGEVKFSSGSSFTPTEDVTLYAMWLKSCSTCGGIGKETKYRDCSKCQGSGRTYFSEACYVCNGVGKTYTTGDCYISACYSGRLIDIITGTYLGICSVCKGTGEVQVPHTCSTCGGAKIISGFITCDSCNGNKYSGTYTVTCSGCDGKCWSKISPAETAPLPVLESQTETQIVLATVEGCEYSKDGETWQASPVFNDLPAATHTFYQRYAETSTTIVGQKSEGLVVEALYRLGDCDGDGETTVDDAIYLAFYTFYPDRYPLPNGMNVDFDKDGEVTVDDAIYLAFYTFYPDRYPLN